MSLINFFLLNILEFFGDWTSRSNVS